MLGLTELTKKILANSCPDRVAYFTSRIHLFTKLLKARESVRLSETKDV